jgi:hypothetical protein
MTSFRLSFVLALLLFLIACSDESDTPDSPNVDSGIPQIGFLSIDGIVPQGTSTLTVPRRFTVLLNPTARGGKSITRVELNVNGINLPSKSSPPWEFDVDFGAIASAGPAILSAVAVDSSGMRSEPATQQVIVDGAPPEITISRPTAGQTIEGDIPVTVTATDSGSGIRSITVLFDGEEVRTQTYNQTSETQTFETTILVASLGTAIPDGQYDIAAQAIDGFGNLGSSTPITITTDNADIVPNIEVEISVQDITPAGQPISGCVNSSCYQRTINIPVNVEDDFGNASVSLTVRSPLGTQVLGPITSFPYAFRLDTASYPDNTELTLIAEGSSPEGNESSRSEPVTITVFNGSTTPTLPVSIVTEAIDPQPQAIPGCNDPQCYRGVISVPVAVRDVEGGGAIVRLIVEGPLGTQALGPITSFPYTFDLDSRIYPDNSELTLTAERRETEDGDPSTSSPVTITVFNSDATPPTINIVRPVDGSERTGGIPITVEATDDESGITEIRVFFDGVEVLSQEFNPPETSGIFEGIIPIVDPLTEEIIADGAYPIFAEVVNGAGLEAQSNTVTVNTTNEGSAPPPPSVVEIGDIAQNSDGTLSVPVRVVVRPGSSVAQVELAIRSEELGTQQALSRDGANTPYVFLVDTQPFANGDRLFFTARATTEAGGVANSEEVSFEVSKPGVVDAVPSFQIVNPTSDQQILTPIMDVEVNVSPISGDAQFRFTDDIRVEVLNFRGDVTAAVTIPTSPQNSPIRESQTYRAEIDVTEFPNDRYTLVATTRVAESEQPIRSEVQFVNRSSNLLPPASIIRMPVRLGDTYNFPECAIDDVECQGLPVFNRNSGILVEITDDDGIVEFVEVRIVCDARIQLPNQDCEENPIDALLLNLDLSFEPTITVPEVNFVYIPAPDIDGSEYVQDGNYILAVTTSDTENRNIQEIAIRVDRSQRTIEGIDSSNLSTTPGNGVAIPGSATWFLTDTNGDSAAVPNPTRVISIQRGALPGSVLTFTQVSIETEVLPRQITEFSRGIAFGEEAIGVPFAVDYLVQDLVTGVVRRYGAADVIVPIADETEPVEPNGAPEPTQTVTTVTAGTATPISVNTVASDADGDSLRFVSIETQPNSGTVSLVSGGVVSYTAPVDASGTVIFEVNVTDGIDTSIIPVTIEIESVVAP